MSLGAELFLALVVTAFLFFTVLFVMLSWFDSRYDKRIVPVAKEEVRSRVSIGQTSHA